MKESGKRTEYSPGRARGWLAVEVKKKRKRGEGREKQSRERREGRGSERRDGRTERDVSVGSDRTQRGKAIGERRNVTRERERDARKDAKRRTHYYVVDEYG